MNFLIRKATPQDVPRLREVIEASVRALQAGDYTPAQIAGALDSVYGVDTQLIADGTYFAVEPSEENAEHSCGSVGARHAVPSVAAAEYFQRGATTPVFIACGGWSQRKTLYGGDQYARREDSLLDPARDAAKIRAFFVHPQWARRGIGTLILEACENAARAAGFTRLEMGATLSGVAFYRAKGYAALENLQVPLSNGEMLPIVRMAKEIKRKF
ncbi:MAG TPA: GNAT family N-acetyltransferase [Candidatus Acidoferrales bacterium]